MAKKIFFILIILLGTVGLIASTKPRPLTWQQLLDQRFDHQKIIIQLGGKKIQVEVVNSVASTTQGLSGRTQIGSDGMLFIFSQPSMLHFWMKEMLFDLDMIWLKDGVVVDMTKHVPAPSPVTSLNNLPYYSPDQPSNGVLEVPAGTADPWQITKEMKLEVLSGTDSDEPE